MACVHRVLFSLTLQICSPKGFLFCNEATFISIQFFILESVEVASQNNKSTHLIALLKVSFENIYPFVFCAGTGLSIPRQLI